MALASTISPSFPSSRVAVSAAFFANGFVIGGWAPQIPILRSRLGIDEPTLGLVILAFGIGSLIAMPLVGAAVSRGGSRAPVILLQVLLAPALPLMVLTGNLAFAFPAALFFGAMVGGMDVAMNANAVAVERGMDRAIMSSAHGFWSVGGFVGAGLGGPLIAALGPLGHSLVVAAAVLLFLVPVAAFMLRDAPEAASAPVEPGSGGLAGLRQALRRDRAPVLAAVGIGVLALFSMIPEGAAIDWSAEYLVRAFEADVQVSGWAFAAFSATMAILRFLGDGIRDRLGAVRTVRLSLVAGIAGLATVTLAPNEWSAIAGFAVLGVGLANLVPVAFSAAGNVPGLKPGVGIAIATCFGYSGILVAPSAIGFAARHFGYPVVFGSLTLLLVVVFIGSKHLRGADRPRG
ncbi:MFS transporter [Antarcticirhabdus aurantiaca]|uniref:MFS transporter n=1 Tax=Antarcticirhabdus aurantiaca TaxID=2606717 RepID=A0ACD4NTR2_9HYPH|nr:MFS transporter [Antarcticirhabdus aurantiaca]WAJ30197.1 MFS transporter [Jeongeuplla avenae]